jgi:hypothetical protein
MLDDAFCSFVFRICQAFASVKNWLFTLNFMLQWKTVLLPNNFGTARYIKPAILLNLRQKYES